MKHPSLVSFIVFPSFQIPSMEPKSIPVRAGPAAVNRVVNRNHLDNREFRIWRRQRQRQRHKWFDWLNEEK